MAKEIEFIFVADISDLQNSLDEVRNSLRDVQTEAEDTGEGLGEGLGDGAEKATKALGAMSGKKGIAGVTAALAAVSPAGAKAVRAIKGIGVAAYTALGPIGLAAGVVIALGVAIKTYAADQELQAAIERTEAMARAATNMQNAVEPLTNSLNSVTNRYAVFSGASTQAEQRILAFNQSIDAQLVAFEQATRASEISEEAQNAAIQAQRGRVELAKELNAEIERQAELDTEAAQAASDKAAADARHNASLQEQLALEQQVSDIILTARMQQLTAEQQVAFAQQQQLALLDQLESKGASLAAVNEARIATASALTFQLSEGIRTEAEALEEALQGIETEWSSTFQTMTMELDMFLGTSKMAILDASADLAGSLADLAAVGADALAKQGKDEALILYRISQASGIAQATIATYTAAANALALPFPPPIPQIAAAAAITGGLAQVGKIAATPPPQIAEHTGTGMIGARDPLAPDEVSTGGLRLLRNEMRTSTLNTQAVNTLNSGRVPSGNQASAPTPWKHLDRELDRSNRVGRSRHARSLSDPTRNRIPQRGW